MEIWKKIIGYELYEVSDHGNVRNIKTKRLKKPFVHSTRNSSKYHRVQLYRNNKKRNLRVHRLVATLFINNPENKPEVNHKDFNGFNNHISNLEWVTSEENIKHYRKSLK